jgi:flagellar assembly factor FliW
MDFSQLAAVAASLAPVASPAGMEADVVATIKNRFGTFDFTDDQLVTLKPGMIGFGEYSQFALAPLPQTGTLHDFRLLQSLDEAGLSFVVYPTMASNSLLDSSDIQFLCEQYGIMHDALVLLHVATFRTGDDGKPAMTLNLKAPVVINAWRQTGTQHVLASNRYSTQFSWQQQAAA